MRRKSVWLKLAYVANLLLLCGLVVHQGYVNLTEPDFTSVHADQVDAIRQVVGERSDFRFAVVGNVNNSVRIFQDEIVPRIHEEGYDFVISAGNAVSGGQAESYRLVHRILGRLEIPYLLTFGDNEESDFGSFRFYEQFGPHFFSFVTDDAHFLFLDGTGKSSYSWQLDWLERELSASRASHRFVFIGLPVHRELADTPVFESDHYLEAPAFRHGLITLFEQYDVDVVFSANLTLFSRLESHGVEYVTTGGAGGLIVDSGSSFHHYIDVQVSEDGIAMDPVPLDVTLSAWQKTLDSLWGAIYSFFYVSYLRFLLIISALLLLAFHLHRLITEERDYYPDYDVDPTPYLGRELRIGMYSNNYFPFVSGVTVSVDRLRRGLSELGNQVLLFVPRYREPGEDDDDIERAPTLASFGEKGEFRLSNPFLPRLYRRLKVFKPDIIHVHHPFWLGSLGLFMGRRLKVPVVYTYHTRLEHYSHFVPLPGMLFRNLISHYLIRRFSNKCQGVVVPTHSAEEYLRVIGVTTNTLVQPTGIDVARFRDVDEERLAKLRQTYDIAEDEVVLVSVSRISQEKNIEFMLEALSVVRERGYDNFRLLLVGDGPARQLIQARIEVLGLDENVVLVGAVPPDEMALYYHLGDIFVFASKSETQGMVILEAMSAGLPVVAVRSSGIDDVILEGENGYKTPENRQAWGERLQSLLEDPELRHTLGGKAQIFAGEHDVSVFARRTHDFYAFLLAQYHSGRRWRR
ncbi:glycosyltransferase [Halomonas vilamensis]|uniref:Glycosyltransferase n=1 Tax=Vreelandella vilamensis TaxID=531309 RepID=A0ABU1H849_9GAMM|nr:glycosyltransferase [Halomonas vilamensis]MDR5900479.1 glycosyltransferase [Halomonas vilamensis]